jgi:hypothetical protein
VANEKQISGIVVLKPFAEGSKSEHEGVWIDTGEQLYKLRKSGGNPFHDDSLNELVGKQITATGILHDYTFVITDIEEKD